MRTANRLSPRKCAIILVWGLSIGSTENMNTTSAVEKREKAVDYVADGIKVRVTYPDADTEALRAEIIKIDEEIRKLMKKLGDADTVLFEYIQNTVNEMHEQKSALERKMQAKARKRRTVDTAPLEKPMKHWDKLSIPEKHELAAVMLEAVYVSDENGVEVVFSI